MRLSLPVSVMNSPALFLLVSLRRTGELLFAVDPAFGGGDFVAGPICVQYGDSIYIPDVIYNSGDKSITQPEVARKAISNNVGIIQMEANKSTASYATETEAEIKKKEPYHNHNKACKREQSKGIPDKR